LAPFRGYCTGLLLPVKRKSVEPMAVQVAPTHVRSEQRPNAPRQTNNNPLQYQ
jgi:SRSO17 transposase